MSPIEVRVRLSISDARFCCQTRYRKLPGLHSHRSTRLLRNERTEVETGLRGSAAEFVQGLRPAGSVEFDLDLPLQYQATEGTSSAPDTYYAVWAPDGNVIHRSVAETDRPRPAEPGMRTREGRRELAVEGPGGSLILVGRDLSDARQAVRTFAGTAVVGGLLALVVSLVGGWVLIGHALAPVGRINRAAAAMAAGDLSARIAVARTESELEQVADALNGTFDRLRRALDTQSRFTADASHELRTPLATMATEVE